MAIEDKDPISDKQSQASDTSASDQVSDKLQDATRGGGAGSSTVQAAQNLTGAKLLDDVMMWQEQITSLPNQTDPSGNLVKFKTDEWTDEHYEKATELHDQLPKRLQIYGAKTQLSTKDLSQVKTMMDLDDKV
jgi:hypothetical protein